MSKNIYSVFKFYDWRYQLKYELCGLFGALLCNRKPPNHSRLLHLGCGNIYFQDFINADYYYLRWLPFNNKVKVDWLQDFRKPLNCPDNYWEGVFTEHTLEHLHYGDLLHLFKELYRTLKQGAWLRIIVPGLTETLDLQAINRGGRKAN